MTVVLRPPTPADETAACALHDQLALEGLDVVLAAGTWPQVPVTREYAGVVLPPDRVRAHWLLAEVDGEVVSRLSIRYGLTDFMRRIGGHVGYAVGTVHRRRGYATQRRRLSLERLPDAGADQVLVTCDDHVASARTIEACGGVLEDVVDMPGGAPKRRYWIGWGAFAAR